MTDSARDFFFALLDTPSPTGFETAGQRVWTDYLRPHADTVETDAYGTAWATVNGSAPEAPHLMLDAHVDEIGFMVRHITDEGMLYVNRIGGSDRAIARGQRVRILGDEGAVTGVVGNTAIHLRDRDDTSIPEVHELFIDIGADSAEAVAARGLRVGHPMVFDVSPTMLTDTRITARAIDNRLGGFIIAQVLKRLHEERAAWTVTAANSVQEEIGGHGAKMITHRLQPDVAVAFDVTHATDSPGISETEHGQIKMGEGPTVTHGTSNHPQVVQRLIAAAEAADIPLQHEPSSRRTGTDTDSIFRVRAGVPSALVSVPLRYMHSTVEVVDTEDIDRCIDLLTAFARALTPTDTFDSGL
ncbi:M42 family metallopeptidase [Salisaeta longa]|uniref:M42 family metallopeptidase n=1 Tax=Salisaeta longa TaxID=503170 RepID=UPI0003B57440|nr:M42 family metallopeptidase [Salisaeta longa]